MKNVFDILVLEKAWRNFKEVVAGFPQSETKSLLDSKAEEVLEILYKERNDLFSVSDQYWVVGIRMATERVADIIRSSSVVLDIDDMMGSLNKALVSVDTDFVFASVLYSDDLKNDLSGKDRLYSHEDFYKEFPELAALEKSDEPDESDKSS